MLKQHINTNAADLSRVDSISAAFSTPSFLIFRTVSLIFQLVYVIMSTVKIAYTNCHRVVQHSRTSLGLGRCAGVLIFLEGSL